MTGRLAVAAAALALLAAAPAQADTPHVDFTLTGPRGDNGWFVGPVQVDPVISGTYTDTDCARKTVRADTAGTQLSCTAWNGAASNTGTTDIIKIDQTAPANVTALPARPPDSAPWYTAPLPITWSGSDGAANVASGIASCTALTYAGPDSANAAPTGLCRDRAGNQSTPVPYGLAYDATAPALTGVSATAAPGEAAVRWVPGPDVQRVTVTREPGDAEAPSKAIADGPQGPAELVDRGLVGGKSYTWTVTVRDAAGNATSARASATPPVPTPATSAGVQSGGKVTTSGPGGRPVLTWRKRAGAKY
jgi:hypothetical protein